MRIVKYITAAVAALVFLVAIGLIVLINPPGERWVKGWLESRLTDELGLPVTISVFETNGFTRAQVRQFTVRADTNASADTLLYISHLRLRYTLPNLLGREIRLGVLAIDSVDFNLTFDSLGHSGIAVIDQPAERNSANTDEPFSIRSDSISLGSLRAGLVDRRLPVTLRVFGAKIQLQETGARSYSGLLALDSLCSDYADLPLCAADLNMAAVWNDDTVRIASATATVAGLNWQARGMLFGPGMDSLDFMTNLNGDPAELVAVAADHLEEKKIGVDSLSLIATVGGTISEPVANVQLEVRQLDYGPIHLPSSVFYGQYVADSMLIDSFALSAFGGNITGSGCMLTDTTRAAEFRMNVSDLSIASLWRAVYGENSPYKGKINADVEVSGSGALLSGWKIVADAHAAGLRYLSQDIPDLDIRATLANNVADLTFRHGPNSIEASLKAKAGVLDGDFHIDLPEVQALAAFANEPELSGRIVASGTISGPFDNPSAKATIGGSLLSYREFPVDTLNAEVTYTDSTVTIAELFCRGRLEEAAPEQVMFGIDSLTGGMDYRCDLSGSFDSLSGILSANIRNISYRRYGLDSAIVRATLDGPRLNLTMADLYRSNLMLHCTGTYDTTKHNGVVKMGINQILAIDELDSVTADTAGYSIPRGTVETEFRYTPGAVVSGHTTGQNIWVGLTSLLTGDTTITDGLADFDLNFEGSLPVPDAELTANIKGVVLDGFLVDSVDVFCTVNRKVLSLKSLRVMSLGQSATMSGEVALEHTASGTVAIGDSSKISGQARIDNFDLSILQPFFAPEGDIGGKVYASIDLGGEVAAPHVTGWMRATDGRIQLSEDAIPMEHLEASLTLSDSVLTIDTAEFVINEIASAINGSIISHDYRLFEVGLMLTLGELGSLTSSGWFTSDSLAVEVQGENVDVSVLQPFLTDVDSLKGALSTDIRMTGSMNMPDVTGSVTMSGLSFTAPDFSTTIRQGYISLKFDKERATIDSLWLGVNGGSVSMSGELIHTRDEISDINLRLQARDVLIKEPEMYTVNVRRADLSYGLQDQVYILDGDVELGETRLTARFRPQSILPWVQAVETVEWEPPELIARSKLNIRLKESSDVWIDNNLARIRMHAMVGIIGTPIRPNLSGQITVDEGYLLYLDRRFRVNEGSVYFSDPVRFNPDILLDASTQVTSYHRTSPIDYKIVIRAEGLMDQLQVSLLSEPSLDKPDIVALLTLGATRTELAGKGEGADGSVGLKDVLADRAAMLTSSRISNYVSSKAGSAFGFSEFTIQGNLFQFDQSWGPQLMASRRLSKRIDMTYTTRVGHLNDQSIQLGYRLTPRLSLQSETDSFGRAGFDLRYGFKFR